MKVLILDFYYELFLRSFYKSCFEVQGLDFKEHRLRLLNKRFGVSDAYSFYLKQNHCDSEEIITNDSDLQLKWAHENSLRVLPLPLPLTKRFSRFFRFDWRLRFYLHK